MGRSSPVSGVYTCEAVAQRATSPLSTVRQIIKEFTMQAAKNIARRILASTLSKSIIRGIVRHNPRVLNKLYALLTSRQLFIFRHYFSDIFSHTNGSMPNSRWHVNFAGRRVLLPLRSEVFGSDWKWALSVLGREPDVVKSLQNIILETPPQLFVDVGANYGLYSLLFLVHGIETVSVEPNPKCYEYFHIVCALNGVTPTIEKVALSDQYGTTDLLVPQNETVLGSIEPEAQAFWQSRGLKMVSQRVETKCLDSYISSFQNRRLLVKLDTEGHEYHVLKGASETLTHIRPLVVFECYPGERRERIFELLKSKQYLVYSLPYGPSEVQYALSLDAFTSSTDSDFIAIPISQETNES